jgi:hypothetical protein
MSRFRATSPANLADLLHSAELECLSNFHQKSLAAQGHYFAFAKAIKPYVRCGCSDKTGIDLLIAVHCARQPPETEYSKSHTNRQQISGKPQFCRGRFLD